MSALRSSLLPRLKSEVKDEAEGLQGKLSRYVVDLEAEPVPLPSLLPVNFASTVTFAQFRVVDGDKTGTKTSDLLFSI